MEDATAMRTMAALAQPSRLAAVRRLAAAGPDGMASGELAAALGTSPNAMSMHLALLEGVGLVRRGRAGQRTMCRAEAGPLEELAAFLATLR